MSTLEFALLVVAALLGLYQMYVASVAFIRACRGWRATFTIVPGIVATVLLITWYAVYK